VNFGVIKPTKIDSFWSSRFRGKGPKFWTTIFKSGSLPNMWSSLVQCRAVNIGVARGAVGARAPPRRRKIFRRNLQGKFLTAPQHTKWTLPGRARVNFGDIFAGRGRFEGGSGSFRPSFEDDD